MKKIKNNLYIIICYESDPDRVSYGNWEETPTLVQVRCGLVDKERKELLAVHNNVSESAPHPRAVNSI